MQNNYNTIDEYLSLIDDHFSQVASFNKAVKRWRETKDTKNLYVATLTASLIRSESVSFPQKIFKIIQEVDGLTVAYLEKLHLMINALKAVKKVEADCLVED